MSDETAPPSQVKISWLLGTLAAFALFAIIASYSSRMTWDYPNYSQQRAAERIEIRDKTRHDEQALISPVDDQGHSTAEWIDQDKKIVRIPIEEAMAEELDTLKSKPAQSGGVMAAPVPAAAASTNAAPAGAAKAASSTGAPAAATNASPAVKTNR